MELRQLFTAEAQRRRGLLLLRKIITLINTEWNVGCAERTALAASVTLAVRMAHPTKNSASPRLCGYNNYYVCDDHVVCSRCA